MKLRTALLVAVPVAVIVVGLYLFRDRLSDGNRIHSRLRDLSAGEQEYANRTDGYAAPIPKRWSVFEERYFPDRKKLTAGDISKLASSCGFPCAAFSVVTLGDFPGVACSNALCSETPAGPGTALTVYGFANPAGLDLDAFLEKALMKSGDGNVLYKNPTEAVPSRMEILTRKDGTELRNYYFMKKGSVYWLRQDFMPGKDANAKDLLTELYRTTGLFTFTR